METDVDAYDLVRQRRRFLCDYDPPTRPTDIINPMTGEKEVVPLVPAVSIRSVCLCMFLLPFFAAFSPILCCVYHWCFPLTAVLGRCVLWSCRLWEIVAHRQLVESHLGMG